MRRLAITLGLLVLHAVMCVGQGQNNTSACSANLTPTAGCNGVGVMPLSTNAGNVGVQTTVVDPLPTNVSPLSVKSYLYSGATTRTIAHYMPWFCNTSSPCNGHKGIGMEESTAAQALAQARWMKSVGVDVANVDYYGCGASCGQTSAHAYELSVTTALASAIAANTSTTPKLMITLDIGAIDLSGTGQCPAAAGDQSACLIAAIDTQIDYLEATWLTQSYYELNATNSHPIVMFFIGRGSWPDTNFGTVYSGVQSHATQGNSCGVSCTYAATVDFLDENTAGFTEAGIAGGFAWPQPSTYSAAQQLCWTNSGGCSNNYLANFYSVARANSSRIAVGLIFKGFDDNNASWGSNRVIAQQCAQVLALTAGAIATAGYTSSSQLQYVQLATWNDYEEGTETETGVDNCLRVGQLAIAGGNLTWAISKLDSTYGTTSTVSSVSIWTGTSAPTTLYASGISPATTSFAAPAPVPGQQVWVQLVGKPLVQNQLSAGFPAQIAPSGFFFASLPQMKGTHNE